MKKIVLFSVLLAGFLVSANAAEQPTQRRGQSAPAPTTGVAPAANPARAARSGPTMAPTANSARSAMPVRSATISARSATSPTVVSARAAAATQKVIGSGVKVTAATANTTVSPECKAKYDGCMDSFCMIDNSSGGRCTCSNRITELNDAWQNIQDLNLRAYKLKTEGVEKIEMGADSNEVLKNVADITKKIDAALDKEKNPTNKRTSYTSLWENIDMEDEMDIFNTNNQENPIDGKKGDGLHRAASEVCIAQIPECQKDHTVLRMIYAQSIKGDCTAFENELKKQKDSVTSEVLSAEKALRDAALTSLRTANKYDLGQCTVEFKKCMATTAGCGDDFKGCVGLAAAEGQQTKVGAKSAVKMVPITGSSTKIMVAASTMDTLDSKKPLCMNVTNSCTRVRDQVWTTFLREVGPQLKTAELLAESDLRTNCIGNISSCFRKACNDTIDPNDPDGSFDMCLSRPETMRSVCKVQIDPCEAAEPQIMDFVYARLAGMRVDSCTREVKECLQSDDRCGKDYTQCVGLDTDTIIRMCPYDKLVGCQQTYSKEAKKNDSNLQDIRGDAVYDELARMVQGIMLGIDNNLLSQCQKAADEAMIKVCGGTEDCNGLAVDDGVGSRSLEYKICEYTGDTKSMNITKASCLPDLSMINDNDLRSLSYAGVLDGTIYWASVEFDQKTALLTPVDQYITKIDASTMGDVEKEKVKSELAQVQRSINTAISAIESDPTVQFCMTGRTVQGMKIQGTQKDLNGGARFPDLTKQMRLTIGTYALKAAKENYYKKYDELYKKMSTDYAKVGERLAAAAQEDSKKVRREFARQACLGLAEGSVMPMSPAPPKSGFGKIAAMVAIAGAAVAVPFTGGASMIAVGGLLLNGAAVAGGAVAAIGLAGNIGGGSANGVSGPGIRSDVADVCSNPGSAAGIVGGGLMASKDMNQWNYKEVVTTTFACDTLICTKRVKSQTCAKTKNPLFGNKYCKDWEDPKETPSEVQF